MTTLIQSAQQPLTTTPEEDTTPLPHLPHLPPDLTLPPVGRIERIAARTAAVAFVLWGALLIGVYFSPAVWEASVHVLDALLWPVIRFLGRFWGTVVIAVLTGTITMICQWLFTDVALVREVRRRLLILADEFQNIHRDTPEEEALAREIRSGQWRVARNPFIPLGLLLGPVMLSFLWLPARVDAPADNPATGAPLTIRATLEGEYVGPVSLRLVGATVDPPDAPTTLELAPVRPEIESLRRELILVEQGLPATATVREHLALNGKSAHDARVALDELLSKPLPQRLLQWSLRASDTPAELSASITTESKSLTDPVGAASLSLPIGDFHPAALNLKADKDGRSLTQKGTGTVDSISIAYPVPHTPFWRPFAFLGSTWDAGWLWLYLIAYIPAMLILKKLLRLV